MGSNAQDTYNHAQTGAPLIYGTNSQGHNQPTTDPAGTYVDAYVYQRSGGATDICDKINNAWADALNNSSNPVTAATIDARGFPSSGVTLNCGNANPFPASPAAKGRLLLGNYTITTTAPWKIPSGVEIVGLGGSGVGVNTTIQAASGFNSTDGHSALIEMGVGTGGTESDAKLRNMTVDCHAQAGCTVGIFNISAVNNSWIQDVVINNASGIGLYVVVGNPGLGGADSGVYQRITIQYSSSCCTTPPIGVELAGDDSGTLVRGLDDITISGCNLSGGSSSSYGIYVVGASTKIVNSNIECFQTGIQIGDPTYARTGSYSTHNVQVDNVYFHCTTSTSAGCPGGTAVAVASKSSQSIHAANVNLASINGADNAGGPLTNGGVLLQYYSGTSSVSLTGNFVGTLAIGDPTCSLSNCLGLLTTDNSQQQWLVPGDFIVTQ